MRRAVPIIALVIAAAFPAPVAAQAPSQVFDGVTMLDYSRPPDFKVGTWLRYHVTGSSLLGHRDDYYVTLLIAGEELWWGERCFWLETWTEEGGGLQSVASCYTYDIFGDSLATKHPTWFLRKTMESGPATGGPRQLLYRREASELKRRLSERKVDEREKSRDTLGTSAVTVPAGTFETVKVRDRIRYWEDAEKADSAIAYEKIDVTDHYFSPKVPLTHMPLQEIDELQQDRRWLIGASDRGPMRILERATGKMELVESGVGGKEPQLTPKHVQRSIEAQQAEKRAKKKPAPAGAKSSASAGTGAGGAGGATTGR